MPSPSTSKCFEDKATLDVTDLPPLRTRPDDSYDAGEDNEISFREGERITEIEEASPDWWEGTSPDGQRGLFPSAYVSTDEQ